MDENSPPLQNPDYSKIETPKKKDLSELIDILRGSVNRFQDDPTPEKFASIITALSSFAISGAEVWSTSAKFIKKYPVRSALSAGLVFFALKGLLASGEKKTSTRDMTFH